MWRKFLLEQKQNYCISPEISTLSVGGVGVLHRDKSIYNGLCEVPVVAAAGLLSCELVMTSASEWLQGCCAELLMYCSEMLNLGKSKMLLVMNLLRETPQKNNNKKEHSEHGVRHEL